MSFIRFLVAQPQFIIDSMSRLPVPVTTQIVMTSSPCVLMAPLYNEAPRKGFGRTKLFYYYYFIILF